MGILGFVEIHLPSMPAGMRDTYIAKMIAESLKYSALAGNRTPVSAKLNIEEKCFQAIQIKN